MDGCVSPHGPSTSLLLLTATIVVISLSIHQSRLRGSDSTKFNVSLSHDDKYTHIHVYADSTYVLIHIYLYCSTLEHMYNYTFPTHDQHNKSA